MRLTPERRSARSKKYKTVDREDLLRGDYVKNLSADKPNYSAKDEYYTPMTMVEKVFEYYILPEQLKGKVIYSPADCEQSNFTKYIDAHKDDLGIQEFIHTSDDFNTHRDLFEKADIVITNPPFSKIVNELLPLLKETNTDYFLFGSLVDVEYYHKVDNNSKFYYGCIREPFDTPFDSKQVVGTNKIFINYQIFMTTLDVNPEIEKNDLNHYFTRYFSKKRKKVEDLPTMTIEDLGTFPLIDYIRDFPVDCDGLVLAPLSAIMHPSFIVYDTEMNEKRFHPNRRKIKVTTSDGKNRYVRVFARKKDIPEWESLK